MFLHLKLNLFVCLTCCWCISWTVLAIFSGVVRSQGQTEVAGPTSGLWQGLGTNVMLLPCLFLSACSFSLLLSLSWWTLMNWAQHQLVNSRSVMCVCVCAPFCNLLRIVSLINTDLVRTTSPCGGQKSGPNVAKISEKFDSLDGLGKTSCI